MERYCPNCKEPLAENLGFRQEPFTNKFAVQLDESGDLEYCLIEDFGLWQEGMYFCRDCGSDLPLTDEEAIALLKTEHAKTAQCQVKSCLPKS